MLSKFFDFLKKLVNKIQKNRDMKRRKLKITRNFKDLKVRRKLTPEQKKEVQDFYKSMIGKKIDLHCHEYFYSRTGVFTKEYVPANFYHCDLVPRANDKRFAMAYGEKNMIDIVFHGENIAHTILKNMNGYYYYEGEAVSREDAIEKCKQIGNVIIKPSRESKGKGVQLLKIQDGKDIVSGNTLAQIIDQYKENFLIQDQVKQHKGMAALNPSSVNTLRILSYRSGMEVLIIYSVVRIGRSGQVIDNQCAGGISTTISNDGKLGKYAFGGYSNDGVEATDTGVVLDGYQIPSYDKAIAFVKKLHLKLPYFNIIGWDVAIQEDGEPILIEYNVNPGLSQSAFCSGMGENTERIIRELWKKPNTWFPD